ncbi:MAG: TetR/AcrR family transcriptional regulator [Anaerolineae bacterium]|nr:TetR/AcrR family transcriptional regulator [Anaerolineae bacterium]
MEISEWSQIHTHILQLEHDGLVTRTFRRLDPERQEAVLSAILTEAIEKGPTSLNIKQVAARAEVSIGSLYQYFGNRDGLMTFTVALCGRYIQDTFAQYREILIAIPIRDGLAAYLLGGVYWGETQKALMQFFVRAAYHGESALQDSIVRPLATQMRELVMEMLAAAKTRGELRSNLDVDVNARIINTLMIALGDAQLLPYLNVYYQVYDEETSLEQVVAAVIPLLLDGVGVKDDS